VFRGHGGYPVARAGLLWKLAYDSSISRAWTARDVVSALITIGPFTFVLTQQLPPRLLSLMLMMDWTMEYACPCISRGRRLWSLALSEQKAGDGLPHIEVDPVIRVITRTPFCWCIVLSLRVVAGRLWIHAAAKVPDPDEIATLEEFYRQIYETAGVAIEFPQHYPTSALLGCVDCVNIVSNEEFRLMRGVHPSVGPWYLPFTLCFLSSSTLRCTCRCLRKVNPRTCFVARIQRWESRFLGECERVFFIHPCVLQRLIWPIRMSGQHKLWNLPHDVLMSAKKGLADVKAPLPVTFPR
jgi:hypothetical protein